MKAAKLIETDEGTYAVKPCDVDEDDIQEATPVRTLEEAMKLLPSMLEQSYTEAMEEPKPMTEGEEAFAAGFKEARGTPMY